MQCDCRVSDSLLNNSCDYIASAEFQRLLNRLSQPIWTKRELTAYERSTADLYTAVMLTLFASVILVLMVRAIKPTQTVDEQVTLLLSTMRFRVEIEDNARQKRRLREAKAKAQQWLHTMQNAVPRRLSFMNRGRSTSDGGGASERNMETTLSVCPQKSKSTAIALDETEAPRKSKHLRAASYSGYLPEIVVTDAYEVDESSPSTRPVSAASSVFSFDMMGSESAYSLPSDANGPFDNRRSNNNLFTMSTSLR
uniref:Uncharacterized protein n=1 Tax=Plectus sambesii TaxID=2011161 RepID=A0A914W4Q9_9BILA